MAHTHFDFLKYKSIKLTLLKKAKGNDFCSGLTTIRLEIGFAFSDGQIMVAERTLCYTFGIIAGN